MATKIRKAPSSKPTARPKNTKGRLKATKANPTTKALFRRRRDLDDYEPRTTLTIRQQLRGRDGPNGRLRDLLGRDHDVRRVTNAKVMQMAEDAGVDTENDHAFLKWLITNLPAILAQIFALFKGAGVMI